MSDKDFTNVELPTGFTGKELRWSMWWLDNKNKVKRGGVIAFIVFDIILVSIGAWGIIDWLAINGLSEERGIRQLTSPGYASLGVSVPAREVKFESPLVLALPDTRYDVVVPVENQNSNHWVELEYSVVIGGEETDLRKDFVLPNQRKFLTELGIRRDGSPGTVELKVSSRKWHRVDAHSIDDYEAFALNRLNITAGEPTFTKATDDEGSKTAFTLTNNSAFNYYDAGLLVLLYRSGAMIGVNRIVMDELRGGEARDIELFWFQNLPQVTRTEVIPDINILDPGSYRPPS